MTVEYSQSVTDSSMLNPSRAARAVYLLKVNMALSRATDEAQILEALGNFTQLYQPDYMTLCYLDIEDEACEKGTSDMVALWQGSKAIDFDPAIYNDQVMPIFPLRELWGEQPEGIVFIDDLTTDARFQQQSQTGARAVILIPLYSAGKYQGVIKIIWKRTRTFTDEEREIYGALMQTLSSVVASRRAYLAEQEARRENELLYRTSQAVNVAGSYVEIVQTVARLYAPEHRVVLTIWENYDYERATWFEVVAAAQSGDNGWPLENVRFPVEFFPSTMSRGELSIVNDLETDPLITPQIRPILDDMSTRSFLSVPLCQSNRWLGTLSFLSDVPRQYSERDQRVAKGMGDLVLSAIERIHLQAETEAARQQAETLARINAGLSQASDEQEILAAVATLAEACGSALSILSYADANNCLDSVNMVALRSGDGRSPLPLSFLPITSLPIKEYPILHLVEAHPYEPLFVENIFDAEDVAADFARRMNWGAIIIIPLKAGDHWQGTLAFVWKEAQTFNAHIRKLFTDIRPTVASVVKSRRAYLAEQEARRETELRAQELETIAKMSATAASILNEDDLIAAVNDLASTRFQQYTIALYLLDEAGQTLQYIDDDQSPWRVAMTSERSLVAQAGRTRQGVIIGDITNAPAYNLAPMLPDARSEMAVPMVVADKLVGVLDIQSAEVDHFDEADIRVMATLADLIAVAIQNARLYKRARVLAALEERNRLARELHDSVSQAIFGIALGARTARTLLDRNPQRLAEPLDYVLSLAEAALTEIRSLIFEMRPESLENDGLVAALQKQAASMQSRHNVRVHTELCDEPEMSIELKETVYRIAREALHNTIKHAHATDISLFMDVGADSIALEIVDNGQGFDAAATYPGHLGLQSMRERAAHVDGTLHIDSFPGSGTRVSMVIPHIR